MEDDFWQRNLNELKKYKSYGTSADLILMSYSFTNYIKEIFPVNDVPEPLAQRLKSLEERISILKETYELCVETVTLEMEKMLEKGELK